MESDDAHRSEKDALRARLMRGFGREKSYTEKQQLKAQSKQRKAEEPRQKRGRQHWDGDDTIKFETRKKRKHTPLSQPLEPTVEEFQPAETTAEVAYVVGLAPGRAQIRIGGIDRDLPLSPELRRAQQSSIAVGDRVLIDRHEIVRSVWPRRTQLSRTDPHAPERDRVIAANVDLGVIVTSIAAPQFKPGVVERIWFALQRGHVDALVVINKVDLLLETMRSAVENAVRSWRALGLRCALVSAHRQEGLAELRTELDQRRCVFVGQSGVGKSSLLNALAPHLASRTGAVRDRDGKGRHTTTRSELFELWPGTEVIDTPGVRQFGLGRVEISAIQAHFADLLVFAECCRFRNCTHLVEPDCAVQHAVRDGHLRAERVQLYARMLAP